MFYYSDLWLLLLVSLKFCSVFSEFKQRLPWGFVNYCKPNHVYRQTKKLYSENICLHLWKGRNPFFTEYWCGFIETFTETLLCSAAFHSSSVSDLRLLPAITLFIMILMDQSAACRPKAHVSSHFSSQLHCYLFIPLPFFQFMLAVCQLNPFYFSWLVSTVHNLLREWLMTAGRIAGLFIKGVLYTSHSAFCLCMQIYMNSKVLTELNQTSVFLGLNELALKLKVKNLILWKQQKITTRCWPWIKSCLLFC